MGTIKQATKSEMKVHNQSIGRYFFSKGTMNVFNSKVETSPNKWNLFITSEGATFIPKDREYKIRFFNADTGEVHRVDHGKCTTIEHARVFRSAMMAQLHTLTLRKKRDLTNEDMMAYIVIKRGSGLIPLLPLVPMNQEERELLFS